MAIEVQGFSGVVAEVDGTTFRAMRVTARGVEFGSLGVYSYGQVSGTMAAGIAGNSEILQFRWADLTRFCLIFGVNLEGLGGSATAFTAGFGNVGLLIARGWSANGSGGTAATLTGNNQKLRTSMGSSLVTDLRIATTAALGAGTKTLDTQPIGIQAFSVGTVANVQYLSKVPLFGAQSGSILNPYPIVLATNEGVSMRVTVPATGTWQFGASVNWAEVAAY